MRADLEVGLPLSGAARSAADLVLRAMAAFLEGLHPERFRDMSNGFGQAVEGCGAGIEARGQTLPPRVQQRVDRVGRASTDFLADFFYGGALALAQECIGGEFDIASGDATGGRAVPRRGGGRFLHVVNDTVYTLMVLHYNTPASLEPCGLHLGYIEGLGPLQLTQSDSSIQVGA